MQITTDPPAATGPPPSAPETASQPPPAPPDDPQPPRWVTLVAVLIAAAGIAVGYALWVWGASPTLKISSDLSAFAGLFILAAAIERLLEPFSTIVADVEQAELAAAEAKTRADSAGDVDVKLAANRADARVAQLKSERTYVLWGVATAAAAIACGFAGVFLLSIVAGSSAPPKYVDLAVTAMVVGAGTQPLHDLISSITK